MQTAPSYTSFPIDTYLSSAASSWPSYGQCGIDLYYHPTYAYVGSNLRFYGTRPGGLSRLILADQSFQTTGSFLVSAPSPASRIGYLGALTDYYVHSGSGDVYFSSSLVAFYVSLIPAVVPVVVDPPDLASIQQEITTTSFRSWM